MKCEFCASEMFYEVVETHENGWVMESDAQRVMVKNQIVTRVEVLDPEHFDCDDFKVGYTFDFEPPSTVVGDCIYEFGDREHDGEHHLADLYP